MKQKQESTNVNTAPCPCCGSECNLEKQKHLMQAVGALWIDTTGQLNWRNWLKEHKRKKWWACDDCIRLKRASIQFINAQCPHCQQTCDLTAQKHLLKALRAGSLENPGGLDWIYWLAGGMVAVVWACDDCFKQGSAVAADTKKQNRGCVIESVAYADREYRCEDCSTDFVFSAGEQKHWYDELGFFILAYPKQCLKCRKLRQRHKDLRKSIADVIHNLDTSDPNQLDALGTLYEEYGSKTKANEYRNRAKNRRRQNQQCPD